MKQSGIILSIIIVVGVSAGGYALVSTLNPCVGDRSYECLFEKDAIQNSQGSGELLPVIPVVSATQGSQVKQISTAIEDQTVEIDTSLADAEAAAKKAKAEADAQRIATEKAAAKLAAEQAAAEKLAAEQAAAQLAAQQAIKKPVVESSDRYEDEEEDD